MSDMSSPESAAEADAAIRDVLRSVVAAWADNNADGIARYYAPHASMVMPGGVHNRNRDEVRAYMAAGFAGPLKGTKSVDQQESVRILGDDAAVVVSLGGILMPGETELPAERQYKATWVLSKNGSRWAVESYHNCLINAA
jgi:uncharacterized protein (TIGR02246 family)